MSRVALVLRRYRVHLAVVGGNVAFAAIFIAVALSGFHQPRPHGVPVGIVASAPVARTVQRELGDHIRGGFDLTSLASERQARLAIERRTVDGALTVSPRGATLLTAQAGGTAPTQAITKAFTAVAAKTGRPLSTIDVVPPLPGDSQALSSFFVILCVLFPSVATGLATGHALRRASPGSRIGVLLSVAAVAGLAAAGIADGISGLGHYWSIAGIVALFSLAISAPTAAVGQIKPHLAALCVLAFLIVGIPVSGGPPDLAAFGPSLLRSLHSGLPLGVAADTVRNTVYFNASDTAGHVWVLAAYAVGGLVAFGLLIAITRRRASNGYETNPARGGVQSAASPPPLARPSRSRARARVRLFMLRHYGFRLTAHRAKAPIPRHHDVVLAAHRRFPTRVAARSHQPPADADSVSCRADPYAGELDWRALPH
jgi:hypothetical protein